MTEYGIHAIYNLGSSTSLAGATAMPAGMVIAHWSPLHDAHLYA